MISRQDPERTALMAWRLIRFDRLWQAGQIGDATYLRSLFIDGVLPDEARSRLNCLKMDTSLRTLTRAKAIA